MTSGRSGMTSGRIGMTYGRSGMIYGRSGMTCDNDKNGTSLTCPLTASGE